MKVYSQLFHTLYDEQVAANPFFGGGAHYSVLRAVYLAPKPEFHDFVILWDRDHDERIIWVAEQLHVRGLLRHAEVLGERQAVVSVYAALSISASIVSAMQEAVANAPSDSFAVQAFNEDFDPEFQPLIPFALAEDVYAFLGGLDALWNLGPKPVEYRIDPFAHQQSVPKLSVKRA